MREQPPVPGRAALFFLDLDDGVRLSFELHLRIQQSELAPLRDLLARDLFGGLRRRDRVVGRIGRDAQREHQHGGDRKGDEPLCPDGYRFLVFFVKMLSSHDDILLVNAVHSAQKCQRVHASPSFSKAERSFLRLRNSMLLTLPELKCSFSAISSTGAR